MKLICEELERMKFNSNIQMLLCICSSRFVFLFQRSYLWRFGKLLGVLLLNLLQPAVGLKDTRTWTHTQWPVSLVSCTCLSPAAGLAASCTALWSSQKTTGLVFDPAPTIHHLKSKEQKKKKRSLLPIIRQTQTSVERQRKGEGETEIDTERVWRLRR